MNDTRFFVNDTPTIFLSCSIIYENYMIKMIIGVFLLKSGVPFQFP